jgi:cell division protein FtsZ
VRGARGVIINVTGGTDLSLIEVSEASAIIQEAAHEDANIIFGAVVDPKMEGKVKITVIATGFDRVAAIKQATASSAVTPVDLHSYTAYQATEKIAASGGGGGGSRLSVSRRPVLEMPIALAAADPSTDTFSPGAEFEPVSPLDVPAFLRRQNE